MSDHDVLLQAVLVGERSRDDAEVQAHLSECADCRRRLERMTALTGSLDNLARQEREDLAPGAGEAQVRSPKFEARLEQTRREALPGNERPVGPQRLVPWLLRAAAVLLLFFVGARLLREEPNDHDKFLGDARAIELVPPSSGEVAEGGTLRWRFDLPPDGYYEVRIVDDTEEARGTMVVRRNRVATPAWSPSDSIVPVELPAAYVVTIEAFSADNVLLTSLTASLPLSSP